MHDEIKEYLDYNSRTGKFTWIKKPSRKTNVGSVAGTKHSSGYTAIMFKGKIYKAHRLAYYFMTGNEPLGYIDHINHNRQDNSWNNLREVTPQQNAMNRTRRTGKVNEAGIWFCKRRKRYIAEIKVNQKKVWQRSFINIDDAVRERKAMLLQYGFHPNHGDSK